MAEKTHKTSIGGAAVLEGVMMRGPKSIAVSVRKSDGEIVTDVKETKPVSKRNWFLKLPIVRGCIGFFESMVLSTKALMFSADFIDVEEENPTKFDQWLERTFGDRLKDGVLYFSVIVSLFLSIGLFILLPTWLVSFVKLFFI